VFRCTDVRKSLEQVLYDPQTSGGLLMAIPPHRAEAFAVALEKAELLSAVVGEVLPRGIDTVSVTNFA
jgi:selenide,water dikinase